MRPGVKLLYFYHKRAFLQGTTSFILALVVNLDPDKLIGFFIITMPDQNTFIIIIIVIILFAQ